MNSTPKSSNSVAIAIPEHEGRPRSGSKGFLDLFRRRRKSGGNLAIPNLMINNNLDVEKPVTSKSRMEKTRRRSNSVQIGETLPISIPNSNSQEPLRIALVKKEFVNRMRLSPSNSSTPMSELLSSSLGRYESTHLFNKKIGPSEFMEMYRQRRFSLSSDSSETFTKVQQKKKGDEKPPSSPLSREPPGSPLAQKKATLTKAVMSSSELKPNGTIPLKPAQNHVTQFLGNKNRRLSVFSPPPDRSEEGRLKKLGLGSRHRRFSEPQGLKMEALRKLSSAHSRVFQPDNISEAMSNFPKLTPSRPKNSRADLGNCLGCHIPLEPAHYVIWKEGKKIERILRLPCTEEEYLEQVEDLGNNGNQVFAKFLKSRRCYELMPSSAKLVILDCELKVSTAFLALTYNGIRSAPIWDGESCEYIGMLTVTDFINILMRYHRLEEELKKACDQRISEWRTLLTDDLQPMVSIDSDTSLYEAVIRLNSNSIHRVLVTDSVSNEALYILTKRRIVHFVWYFFQVFHLPIPDFMEKSVKELDIGTYSDLASVREETPLFDVLKLLTERHLSIIPVVDDEGHVVNAYGKSDVMNLVTNESFLNLERSVGEELKNLRPGFEGVYLCEASDSLGTVIDRIIRADVHRLIVVDNKRRFQGVVSLSDVIHFLVLQKNYEDLEDIESCDAGAEKDLF